MVAAVAGATGAATADGLQAPNTNPGTDIEAAKTIRPEITKRHNGYGALSSLTMAVAHLCAAFAEQNVSHGALLGALTSAGIELGASPPSGASAAGHDAAPALTTEQTPASATARMSKVTMNAQVF